MDKLLPYYERELGALRRGGAEFAARYPRLAAHLRLSADSCADPHVERLIQATAFLNARAAKLLDDGHSRFTEALLGMLYPHYLRPMPACAIAQLDGSGAKGGAAAGKAVTLPRGTAMKSTGHGHGAVAGRAVACHFRSAYDIAVGPVVIAAAGFEPYIQAPPSLALPHDAGSAILIGIAGPPGQALARAGLSRLRVFIDGEASLRATLRDMLFMRAACACVEADGQWRMLARVPLAAVGFADDEALLPAAPSEHSAYRLLSEYFAFPEKFDFFDIDLAALLAAVPAGATRLTLRIALAGVRADAPAARILRTLSADHLVLGCSPVINLFEQSATPIRVHHQASSYPLVPDQVAGGACEIYSIDSVHLLRKLPGGDTVTEFFPYYSLRHGEAASRKGRYWLAHRDEDMASAAAGHEYTLALVDRDFSPLRLDESMASVRLTCTNRDLPRTLLPNGGPGRAGHPGGDLVAEAASGKLPIRLLRRPTASYRQAADGASHWGLIAQLSLNHRSLTQEGLPALTAMLRLYARPDNAVSQRQIDGITALSHVPATAWVREARGNAYLRGVEVRVTLDEEAYAGSGVHAFAQLLDHLFGLYVHLNSFTQLVVLSHASGKELMRCPPRNGALPLA